MASRRAVLYGNVLFSIVVLLPKKLFSNFSKKAFNFQKTYFKIKVMKMKLLVTAHNKYRSYKQKAIFKILIPFFTGAYVLPVGFKMKPL